MHHVDAASSKGASAVHSLHPPRPWGPHGDKWTSESHLCVAGVFNEQNYGHFMGATLDNGYVLRREQCPGRVSQEVSDDSNEARS